METLNQRKDIVYPQRHLDSLALTQSLSEFDLVFLQGAPGSGKTEVINRAIEEHPNDKVIPWHCRADGSDDVLEVAKLLASEVREENTEYRNKQKKEDRVHFVIGIILAVIGFIPLGQPLTLIMSFIGVGITAHSQRQRVKKGLKKLKSWVGAKNKQVPKTNSISEQSGHHFTLAQIHDELTELANYKNKKLQYLVVFEKAEHLDESEQLTLIKLLDTFSSSQVQLTCVFESPQQKNWSLLTTGADNATNARCRLDRLQDAGAVLRIVFPAITENQIDEIRLATSGIPKQIDSVIEEVIDEPSFFEGKVNVSRLLNAPLAALLREVQLSEQFVSFSALSRRYDTLKLSDKRLLTDLAKLGSKFLCGPFEKADAGFAKQFRQLLNNEDWFSLYDDEYHFVSRAHIEFLLSREGDDDKVEKTAQRLVQLYGSTSLETLTDKQLYLLFTQQCRCGQWQNLGQTLTTAALLFETKEAVLMHRAVPHFARLLSTSEFDSSQLEANETILLSIFCRVLELIEPESLAAFIACQKHMGKSVWYRLCSSWLSYLDGNSEQSIQQFNTIMESKLSHAYAARLSEIGLVLYNRQYQTYKLLLSRLRRNTIANPEDADSYLTETEQLQDKLALHVSRYELLQQWLQSVHVLNEENSEGAKICAAELLVKYHQLSLANDEKLNGYIEALFPHQKFLPAHYITQQRLWLVLEQVRMAQRGKKSENKAESFALLDDKIALALELKPLVHTHLSTWALCVDFLYQYDQFDPSCLVRKKSGLPGLLQRLLDVRDIERLDNNVYYHQALFKLSQLEASYYAQQGRGCLVDRAVTRIVTFFEQQMIGTSRWKIIDQSSLVRIFEALISKLDIYEYTRLIANTASQFIDLAEAHFEDEPFSQQDMMWLASKAARACELVGNEANAVKYYQLEHRLLTQSGGQKRLRPDSTFIVLNNLALAVLRSQRSSLPLHMPLNASEIAQEASQWLAKMSGCKDYKSYLERYKRDSLGAEKLIKPLQRMTEVYIALGNESLAERYSAITLLLSDISNSKKLSRITVQLRIDSLLLRWKLDAAFKFFDKRYKQYGDDFIRHHIYVIVRLLAAHRKKPKRCELPEVKSLSDAFNAVISEHTLSNKKSIKDLGQLVEIIEALEESRVRFPLHPGLIQTKVDDKLRSTMNRFRKTFESKGQELDIMLYLLYLMASSNSSMAEYLRQLGAVLKNDNRFGEVQLVGINQKISELAWNDNRILFELLKQTHKHWSHLVQANEAQRVIVIENILSSLEYFYTMDVTELDNSTAYLLYAGKDKNLLEIYARLVRHSSYRAMATNSKHRIDREDMKARLAILFAQRRRQQKAYWKQHRKPLARAA